MNFSKALNMWNDDFKSKVFDILQRYGEIDEMISYIENMSSFYEYPELNIELAITEAFFCCWEKERFVFAPTEDIDNYYCCELKGCSTHYEIGLIFASGYILPFMLHRDSLVRTVGLLNQYIPSIDSHISTFTEYESPTLSFHTGKLETRITVNSQELIAWREKINIFSKNNEKKILHKINRITNIIWCVQSWEDDFGDTPAYASLQVYLTDGQTQTFSFFGGAYNSDRAKKAAYELALHIKDNVPHLLYGPSEEYKKLFKENPMRLLEYAKEKAK